MVHPPSLGLKEVCYGGKEGMQALQDGALHRDMGLREEVGERRQEEVWGIPEVETGQGDWQGACCVMYDEPCLLHSDLRKQQSVHPTGCSREGKMSVRCSGAACHLPQLWARGRERRGFSGESNLIQESPLFISLPPPPPFMFICAVRYLVGGLIYSFYVCQGNSNPD